LTFSFASTIQTKTLLYYFKYNLDAQNLAGIALAMIAGMVLILTPMWIWLARKTSKRLVTMIGLSFIALGNAILLSYQSYNPHIVLFIFSISALGTSAMPVMLWSMLPDTNEVSLFKYGISLSGIIYGLSALAIKISAAMASLLLGFSLEKIGFIANEIQTPSTLNSLHIILTLPSLIGALIGLSLTYFYSLDNVLHTRLVQAIDRRGLKKLA